MKTYNAEKPCKRGHWPCSRYFSTGNCVQCQKDHQKARPAMLQARMFQYTIYIPVEKHHAFETCMQALGIDYKSPPKVQQPFQQTPEEQAAIAKRIADHHAEMIRSANVADLTGWAVTPRS